MNDAKRTTIFFLPGTAFTGRAEKIDHAICSLLAQHSGYQTILVNHRLAPENKFPTPYNDIKYIVRYFLDSQEKFKINPEKIIFAGYSSGATFIIPLILNLVEKYTPALQVLMAPIPDFSRSMNEYRSFENKDNKVNENFIAYSRIAYIPKKISLKNPLLSPLWETDANLSLLPNTFIVHGEYDRLRGDSEKINQRLILNNIPCLKWMIKEENHAFLWFNNKIVPKIGKEIKSIMESKAICRQSIQIEK